MIELLIVITILTILTVTVFVALKPAQRIQDANDARRSVDVSSILSAVHQYTVDNSGDLPSGLSAGMNEKQLGTATTGCAVSTGGCSVSGDTDCLDMSSTLSSYLAEIPIDPQGTSSLTGYTIKVNSDKQVIVRACKAQGGSNIYTSQ